MKKRTEEAHSSPQQKCECYKARGNMYFTSTSCTHCPFSSINNSLIYSVSVCRYRFTLHGKKKKNLKISSKQGGSIVVVVNNTGSNSSSTKKYLGDCGQTAYPIHASVSYLLNRNGNNTIYLHKVPGKSKCDFRWRVLCTVPIIQRKCSKNV